LIWCDTSAEINLEALPLGGYFDGDGVDGNIFYPSISGVGIHQISYSFNNEGCISNEMQEITVENCSSLNELTHNIKIWPNPFEDEIHIELPNNTKYCLIDIQGQMVAQGFSESSGIVELKLTNIDSGMYYIIFESNLKRSAMSIVKR